MRPVHIIVCAALVALTPAPGARAQDSAASAPDVTELVKRPPRDLKNSDLLALSERERALWIHGAMAQMAQTLAARDAVVARCVVDWYFKIGNGPEIIPEAMKLYPDQPPTATIFAIARKACPDL